MELVNDSVEHMVDAWLAARQSAKATTELTDNSWADDLLFDWTSSGEGAEKLWQFVSAAYKREMSDETAAVLAAGPLEDLLAHFGPEYIDRVEQLARTDPKFNWLLGGIWRNSMTDDVWDRIQKIRSTVW